MAFNYEYPYTDPNRYNSDWLLNAMKKLQEEWNIFVPTHDVKFGGIWNGTLTYGAYTIVADMNNDSYISRKAVPAGVQISDTEYWVRIGNYNAQLHNVEAAQAEISAKVEDIDAVVSRSVNKRMIVISDSYGLGRNNTTGWTTYLQQLVGLTGNSFYTWSIGSMGFNRAGEGGFICKTLLEAHEAEVETPESITDIIFGLGANDTLAVYGLGNAITECVAYCKRIYHNAKIHIGFIGNMRVKNTGELVNYINALQTYQTSCGENSASYIEGVEYIMHDDRLLQADNVHPTSAGSLEIAKFINAYINGSAYNYKARVTCPIVSDYFNGSLTQVIDGNTAYMNIDLGQTKAPLTFPNRSYIAVGTISGGLFQGIGGNILHLRPVVYFNDGYRVLDAYLYQNTVYLSSLNVNSVTTLSDTSGYGADACTPTIMI